MHPYATDSNERRLVPCFIALSALIAALAAGKLLEYTPFTLPWWFDTPAVLGFYNIFYWHFNKFLWKCNIFRKIRLIKIPNLDGTWKGYATSSFDKHSKKYGTTFTIQQDWNRISIVGEFEMSKSYSLIASVLVEDKYGITLSYEYRNEPSSPAVATMETHRGFNNLTLKSNGKEMSGDYYTGRGRRNIGQIELEKV